MPAPEVPSKPLDHICVLACFRRSRCFCGEASEAGLDGKLLSFGFLPQDAPAGVIRQLPPEALAAMPVSVLKNLRPEQMAALTGQQLAAMSAEQLQGLSAEQLAALSAEAVSMLPAELRDQVVIMQVRHTPHVTSLSVRHCTRA